eukprot:SM000073S21409  [mRNA]  locus=s73:91434:93631:+ [translate_table: standard]
MVTLEGMGPLWRSPLRSEWRLLLILLFLASIFVSLNADFFGGLVVQKRAVRESDQPIGEGAHVRDPVVREVVYFSDQLILKVRADNRSLVPSIENVKCVFDGRIYSEVYEIEDDWSTRCALPPQDTLETLVKKVVTLEVGDKRLRSVTKLPKVPNWRKIVYEIVILKEEVLLFVKGLTNVKDKKPSLERLKCIFANTIRTEVVGACMENVRCSLPPMQAREYLYKKSISVEVNKKVLRSIVRYLQPLWQSDSSNTINADNRQLIGEKKHKICACTMLWNGAKLLKEWVMYHAFLGVERVLLYDNNSDDDLQEEVDSLHLYNVSRHPWPWQKTQEAGFAHCAIRAEAECEWMAFIDIDEFIYPKELLAGPLPDGYATTLSALLGQSAKELKAGHQLGAVMLMCHNFGPSGLSTLPRSGQSVNYVCRLDKPERHKSIVRLDALDPTRCTRVHHFDLQQGYESYLWPTPDVACINHYKFPVWEDFRSKYHRRVATFVKDWTEKVKVGTNRDRVADLGTEAVEPEDWPHRFCEVTDTSLREYVLDTFTDPRTGNLPWT